MGKFSLWLTLVLAGGLLRAQSDRGTLTGQVTDPSGAAVPNVTVVWRIGRRVKYTSTTTETAKLGGAAERNVSNVVSSQALAPAKYNWHCGLISREPPARAYGSSPT